MKSHSSFLDDSVAVESDFLNRSVERWQKRLFVKLTDDLFVTGQIAWFKQNKNVWLRSARTLMD